MADCRSAVTAQADTAGAAGLAAVALLVAGTFFMENLDATVITPAIRRWRGALRCAPST